MQIYFKLKAQHIIQTPIRLLHNNNNVLDSAFAIQIPLRSTNRREKFRLVTQELNKSNLRRRPRNQPNRHTFLHNAQTNHMHIIQ
ncbi:hypothetical protein SNEBB_008634 [Seison nebaliae]|nr:hypothetical protein SNEBB_008634 [Seison nebaliae]